MRTSLYLGTVVLGLWLAGGAVGPVKGPGGFMLEVPARVLSVGQQFSPRLVSIVSPVVSGAAVPVAPPAVGATVVPETVAVELLDAGGHKLAAEEIDFSGGAAMVKTPWSLPHAGTFRVRASTPDGTQTVEVNAQPEPASDLGGVTALASWGVPAGAAGYLRQHGFVVTEVNGADAAGVEAALSADPLIVVGDPRLEGGDLTADYTALWRAVDRGARLLVLEPPPPGVRAFWPIQAPLRAAAGACDDWAGLSSGNWAPAPQLSFDLSSKSALDIYRWDGTFVPRAHGAGYPGCHSLFSVRYGAGWVTLSTVPLLEHFQDVRARLDLMMLIKASLRRKHRQPASPGLAWVMRQKLKALSQAPPNPLATGAAVWYRPSPAPVIPAAELIPAANDGDPQSCWIAPAAATGGATVRLQFSTPQPVHGVRLNFGAQGGARPDSLRLEASADGVHWTPLPLPASAAGGTLEVAVPSAPGTGQATDWRDFQLIAAAGHHRWRLCEFSAH